jgi:hypothetical protein
MGMGPQILKKFYSCTIDWLHRRLVWQLLGTPLLLTVYDLQL